MATENQVNANRKNALKSTGPRTQEGKDASSQNAVKHGLRAKRDVIKTENQDDFVLYRTKMLDDLSPDGAMEEMLSERIVSLSWRLKRAEHFQNAVVDALIEHGLYGFSSGFGWTSENRERAQQEAADGDMDVLLGIVINHDFANAKTLEQLLVYERRIESSLYRTIAELKKAKRMRNEQKEETAWAEAHPTSDCTNEPNLEDESNEDHPHSDKKRSCCDPPNIFWRTSTANQDEDATHLQKDSGLAIPKGDTEETAWAKVHPTCSCTNEANYEGNKRKSNPHHEDINMMGMPEVIESE